MQQEYQTDVFVVIGPPGTGKTTYAARQAVKAVEAYGPEGVMLLSLTKAAASEIASRNTGVDEMLVGTMHSHAYRLQDKPQVVGVTQLEEWNAKHPQWRLDSKAVGIGNMDDQRALAGNGMYREVDLYRSAMKPVEEWPSNMRSFWEKWRAWLDDNEYLDFTRMLELVVERKLKTRYALGAIIADEVQDFSPLEMEVLRFWSMFAEKLVIVGDNHQSLYSFRGATEQALDKKPFKILDQSYRVPKKAHELAVRLMGMMDSIEPVLFEPTEEEGSVVRSGGDFKAPLPMYNIIKKEHDEGRSVMVIAQSAYMLSKLQSYLRRDGYVFWNPFAPRSRGWNPLHPNLDFGAKSTLQRFQAFLAGSRGHWTAREFKLWAPLFVNCWKHGTKKLIEDLNEDASLDKVAGVLNRTMDITAMQNLFDATEDPKRCLRYVAKPKQGIVKYMVACWQRATNALYEQPRIVLGTIHSVKGGEADTVCIFPDVSAAAAETARIHGKWEGRDSLLRLFYVAVTRTRDKLVIATPAAGTKWRAPIL